MRRQLSLFEQDRATEKEAIALTAQSLLAYGQDYKHWQISYSGGKDSTTLVTLVLHLIESGEIPRPDSLTVMYADTRLELPPLHQSALKLLDQVKQRGFNAQVVMAPLDKRFLVYVLGRGVPPPNNNTLRWCTSAIKLEPMKAAMQGLYGQLAGARSEKCPNSFGHAPLAREPRPPCPHEKHGKLLSLNGVRIGESAMRDRRIALSCSKNGSECGQGWFQRDLPDAICDKLAPILHWRVCHIWDWLMLDAPRLGFDTEILAQVYGGDEATEMNARTGCIGCPLATKDMALDHLIEQPDWTYLAPLKRLRPLWEWARRFDNRLQKVGETKKDGSYSSNPSRKGPLTLSARSHLLGKILAIEQEVNQVAIVSRRPTVSLINDEEHNRILGLIEARTFPNGWTGDEPNGGELVPQYDSNGNVQPTLF